MIFGDSRPAGRQTEIARTLPQNRSSVTAPRNFVCNSKILCLTENARLTADAGKRSELI